MEWLLLFLAGVLGGIINSVAGGGSFITFPSLMFVGVPPIVANATNTFASCAGYLSGAYGFRRDIARDSGHLPSTILFSMLGGGLGAYLLLQTPEALFMEAIPWLLLFATCLFIWGGEINRFIRRRASHHKHASVAAIMSLALLLVLVAAYGGFFNAGLGIIVLSYLSLAGYSDINLMNGVKLLVSSCVSILAIAVFILDGSIDWWRGLAVMAGTLTGGYLAARVSRNVKQKYVRWFVIISSLLMTGYFFFDVYVANNS
ncbi:sulfite exporter TauE/SafE family protein [Vibrio sp.]|uniref:sulfite exporter TauE/SafE family protein n=1 Tax=Vibrio sp. TaxID=678 RepID=UPI003D0EF31D